MRKFRIYHCTHYQYDNPVLRSRNLCLLYPRHTLHQNILSERLIINPEPELGRELSDGLGNRLYDFTVTQEHLIFEVALELVVEIQSRLWSNGCNTLLESKQFLRNIRYSNNLDAHAFLHPSKNVVWNDSIRELSDPLRDKNLSPHDCAQALMEQIFREWKFKAGVTGIHTTVSDLLTQREGVCQDFTHLMLAALRHLGIPARYVSGYLETLPKPGKPKLVGADVSHAWVQAFDPIAGWKDFDPTNNVIPAEQHITMAYGRDFTDISPLRGLISGGGGQTMKVSVDVAAIL